MMGVSSADMRAPEKARGKRMHKAALLVLVLGGGAVWGQQTGQSRTASAQSVDRGSAYYYYSLAHMYAELAGAYGNRGDFVNRAIDNYKEAIKADPSTPMLSEELSDLYVQSGRLREAQSDAEEVLKQNPNDLNAHRLLARIFTRLVGDGQQTKIDEAMLHRAIDQYQKITAIDAKDVEAWLMLARLQKVADN